MDTWKVFYDDGSRVREKELEIVESTPSHYVFFNRFKNMQEIIPLHRVVRMEKMENGNGNTSKE